MFSSWRWRWALSMDLFLICGCLELFRSIFSSNLIYLSIIPLLISKIFWCAVRQADKNLNLNNAIIKYPFMFFLFQCRHSMSILNSNIKKIFSAVIWLLEKSQRLAKYSLQLMDYFMLYMRRNVHKISRECSSSKREMSKDSYGKMSNWNCM